jgi:salicylate hydroxylase
VKAAIVGGGIGGLAASVALRRAGVETVVFERARRLETVGAGLTLSANAVRALDRLGIADAVRGVSGRGRQLLVRAGYEPSAARRIAARHEIDLHHAVDLLERGCNAELALAILL